MPLKKYAAVILACLMFLSVNFFNSTGVAYAAGQPPFAGSGSMNSYGGQSTGVANYSDPDSVLGLQNFQVLNAGANVGSSLSPMTIDGANVTFLYTAAPGYSGVEVFNWQIVDPDGNASNIATMTVQVVQSAPNSAPISGNSNYSTSVDTPVSGQFQVTDPEGDPFTVAASVPANQGGVSNPGGGKSFTFYPAKGFTGTATITFFASSANGNSNQATVSISVSGNSGQASAGQASTSSSTPNPTQSSLLKSSAFPTAREASTEFISKTTTVAETNLWGNSDTTWSGFTESFVAPNIYAVELRKFQGFTPEFAAFSGSIAMAFVLSALVALPSGLLENAISGSHSRIAAFFRVVFNDFAEWTRRFKTRTSTKSRRSFAAWLFSSMRGWRSYIIVIIGSLIASFSDPSFGFNGGSLNVFLTIFFSFVFVNVFGTLAIWAIMRKHSEIEKPEIAARPIYLIIILATVVIARVLQVEPALVFGSVLAVDYGLKVSRLANVRAEVAGALYIIVIGLAAWSVYLLSGEPVEIGETTSATLVQNISATLCVQALSTLPILLLPFAFLNGTNLWHWRKWAWAIAYSFCIGIYSWVLLPLPFAWSGEKVPYFAWVSVFTIYSLIALVVWVWLRKVNSPRKARSS